MMAVSDISDSSLASVRDLTLRSCKEESSAERPRFKPDSNADSTLTLNHDSIERETNCTETK